MGRGWDERERDEFVLNGLARGRSEDLGLEIHPKS